jgi:hypothetical protein
MSSQITPSKIAAVAPFARYALIAIGAKVSSGGILPEGLVNEIAADPLMVEMVAGGVIILGTVLWYRFSAAYAVLRSAVKDALD